MLTGVAAAYIDFFVVDHQLMYEADELPTLWQNFLHIVFSILVYDILNFCVHKSLHLPFIYPYFHKIHH